MGRLEDRHGAVGHLAIRLHLCRRQCVKHGPSGLCASEHFKATREPAVKVTVKHSRRGERVEIERAGDRV